MAHQGITYRLVLGTKARARQLACLAGVTRYMWHELVAYQQQLYEVHFMHNAQPRSTSFFTLGKYFTALRAENPCLQELYQLTEASCVFDNRGEDVRLGIRSFLVLLCGIQQSSQKQVGEAFVLSPELAQISN